MSTIKNIILKYLLIIIIFDLTSGGVGIRVTGLIPVYDCLCRPYLPLSRRFCLGCVVTRSSFHLTQGRYPFFQGNISLYY